MCAWFVRLADGSWGLVSFVGLAFTSDLTRVPLADLYAGVIFPDPPG